MADKISKELRSEINNFDELMNQQKNKQLELQINNKRSLETDDCYQYYFNLLDRHGNLIKSNPIYVDVLRT